MMDKNLNNNQALFTHALNFASIKTYPGHHEWDVWRKCASEKEPLQFKW